jgi:hypothetical protein
MSLKDFRLTEETAFLFVLSYEYGLSFTILLNLYELSDALFWGYISALTPALKMGVRKGSQLSRTSQRIYKSLHGLKERQQEKVEKIVEDEEGNVVVDKTGNHKKEKITVNRYEEIELTPEEVDIRDIILYYTTKGYSNGNKFYSDDQIMDMKTSKALKNDLIDIDGDSYLRCSQLEHFIEKYMPDIDMADFSRMSLRDLKSRITEMTNVEVATVEA